MLTRTPAHAAAPRIKTAGHHRPATPRPRSGFASSTVGSKHIPKEAIAPRPGALTVSPDAHRFCANREATSKEPAVHAAPAVVTAANAPTPIAGRLNTTTALGGASAARYFFVNTYPAQ